MNDSGLITLKCVKNRFGEKRAFSICPDFNEGRFEVKDVPTVPERDYEAAIAKATQAKPGMTQKQIISIQSNWLGLRHCACWCFPCFLRWGVWRWLPFSNSGRRSEVAHTRPQRCRSADMKTVTPTTHLRLQHRLTEGWMSEKICFPVKGVVFSIDIPFIEPAGLWALIFTGTP